MNEMAIRSVPAGSRALCRTAVLTLLSFCLSANAATTAAGAEPFSWVQFLGPFHHLVLHYPIGFVTLAFLLELLFWRRPSSELRRFISLVIALGAATAIVTVILGLMRAAEGGYDPATVSLHRNFGIAVAVLSAASAVVALGLMRQPESRQWLWGYRSVIGACMAAIVITGHEGGNLSHGSNYLTKAAPPFIKRLMGESAAQSIASTNSTVSATGLYEEKIRPVLEKQCFQCHGAEKQKGGLRLDQMASALKGGDSEKPAIKPGDPMASELVRLILLPRDHDDAMPPSGKGQLTSDQILDLIHWIQAGAVVKTIGAGDPNP